VRGELVFIPESLGARSFRAIERARVTIAAQMPPSNLLRRGPMMVLEGLVCAVVGVVFLQAGVLHYRSAKKHALLARKLPERSTKDLPKPAAKK
jgi:hypothetical protein